MKVLVTGASGVLGSDLSPVLLKEGYDVTLTDLKPEGKATLLDVRDASQVDAVIGKVKPDIVMHLAAETDVDRCQVEPDHAFRSNTLGTWNVALICQRASIAMAYISTAGVFDGAKKEPYVEFDAAYPANTYGKSKLEGERLVSSLLSKFYIVRAAWMIGGGPKKDKKFVNKIMEQVDGGAKAIRAVNDKVGSLTYSYDFSKCITRLIKTGWYGLYHMANKGTCTRYDVAKEILTILGRNDITVKAVTSDAFVLPAPRANSEMLDNYCLEMRGLNDMRDWREALRDYLQTHYVTHSR